jgi:hypothetical protein
MTALVWGVINSAKDGWSSAQTIGGFVVACSWPSASACSRS